MLPQALLLCLEIKVADEDTATCIVWRWVCNGVDADVAIENDVAVKFESFTGGCSGREYDVGVEGLLLLVELVGYECGFAGNLFREGDGAETHRGDFPGSREVRFKDFVVGLLWVSYETEPGSVGLRGELTLEERMVEGTFPRNIVLEDFSSSTSLVDWRVSCLIGNSSFASLSSSSSSLSSFSSPPPPTSLAFCLFSLLFLSATSSASCSFLR